MSTLKKILYISNNFAPFLVNVNFNHSVDLFFSLL